MSEVSDFICKTELKYINPIVIEKYVLDKLNEKDYGMRFEYFKVTNFASVRTFRLIQDGQSWVDNSLQIDKKR